MFNLIKKYGFTLAVIFFVAASIVMFTYVNTKDRIKQAQQEALYNNLAAVMPSLNADSSLMCYQPATTLSFQDIVLHKFFVHKTRYQEHIAVLELTTNLGYSGDITILLGVDSSLTITGVRTLQHAETPGLGDKIDIKKSPWILNFVGKKYTDATAKAWNLTRDKGEFDQLSGATITSNAYLTAIKQALIYLQNNNIDYSNFAQCEGIK